MTDSDRPANATTDAFAARCVLRAARWASLATQSEGQPYASLVTPAVLPDGSVLLFLSGLATHTRHLKADPRCALLAVGAPASANPQTAPRVTLTGEADPVEGPDALDYWRARHGYAFYTDLPDFSVWRLTPRSVQYVGGFGRACTMPAARYAPDAASREAVAGSAERVVAHCNQDHADVLDLLARRHGATGAWRMLSVDTDGFDLVQGELLLRIAFTEMVRSGADIRAALVRMSAEARAEEAGRSG